MRATAEEQRTMSRAALLAYIRALRPAWSEEEYGPWADAKLRLSTAYIAAPRLPDRTGWLDALPAIICPTLLLTADPEHDAIVTPEAAQEAERLNPALCVVRLRSAGHNLRREQFDGFVQAVRAFLAGLA
jgi:pimeloyl-ACP methyl ester carboxylesterase